MPLQRPKPERKSKPDLSDLGRNWPSTYVARTEIPQFSGGAMSEKYMANLDSLGEGPPGRIRIGRRIVYHVPELIEWLENRAEVLD